jgi:hypothetical protein
VEVDAAGSVSRAEHGLASGLLVSAGQRVGGALGHRVPSLAATPDNGGLLHVRQRLVAREDAPGQHEEQPRWSGLAGFCDEQLL